VSSSRRLGSLRVWLWSVQVLTAAVLALGVVVVGAGVAAAQPSSGVPEVTVQAQGFPPGTPGPFKIRNPITRLCLDTYTDGRIPVYMGRCNSSDAGQRWGWWNGGWLINLATGKCIQPSYFDTPVWQGDCSTETGAQFWTHRNGAIVNTRYGTCLQATSEGARVPVRGCLTTPFQAWTVTYW
jgi:hypothetical protein